MLNKVSPREERIYSRKKTFCKDASCKLTSWRVWLCLACAIATCQSVVVTFCIRRGRVGFAMVTNNQCPWCSAQHHVDAQSCFTSSVTWQGVWYTEPARIQTGRGVTVPWEPRAGNTATLWLVGVHHSASADRSDSRGLSSTGKKTQAWILLWGLGGCVGWASDQYTS